MTTTSEKSGRRLRGTRATASPAPAAARAEVGARVGPPPRLRRRPMVIVWGIAAVILGAAVGVWMWTAGTSSAEVVAVRVPVARGAVIGAENLMRVRVGLDPSLKTIPANQLGSLVGKRAAQDMSAGSLVTPQEVSDTVVPAAGMSLVGLSLAAGQLPAEPLRSGDQVRVVSAAQQGAELKGPASVIPATVMSVSTSGEAKTGGTKIVVDLLLPSASAPDLAARANSGNLAVVLDSRER